MPCLDKDVLSQLGEKPIEQIGPKELLQTIQKVKERKAYDLANRLRQWSSVVFQYAIASSYSDRNPASEIK